MSGVPIFPAGIVKQYNSPIPFIQTTNFAKFDFVTYKGSTKLRSEQKLNILLDKSKTFNSFALITELNGLPEKSLV